MSHLFHTATTLCLTAGLALLAAACGTASPLQDSQASESHASEALSTNRSTECVTGCRETLTGAINLPADDAVHPASLYSNNYLGQGDLSTANIEWFYYSGHLVIDDGREFGFVQIFYLSPQGEPIQYVDATITDIARNAYYYGGRQFATGFAPVLPNAFDLTVGTEHAKGGNGHDLIHGEVHDGTADYRLDLVLTSVKTPVQHIADGFVFYYSRERMLAVGAMTIDGTPHMATGQVWFDHQFGPQEAELQYISNWTWTATQLDNDTELFALVSSSTVPLAGAISAAYTDADCNTTQLTPSDFSLTPTGSWTTKNSNGSACTYGLGHGPLGWTLAVPSFGLNVQINPVVQNQDILTVNPYVSDHYYEGDTSVSGNRFGLGYVELNGYCN